MSSSIICYSASSIILGVITSVGKTIYGTGLLRFHIMRYSILFIYGYLVCHTSFNWSFKVRVVIFFSLVLPIKGTNLSIWYWMVNIFVNCVFIVRLNSLTLFNSLNYLLLAVRNSETLFAVNIFLVVMVWNRQEYCILKHLNAESYVFC